MDGKAGMSKKDEEKKKKSNKAVRDFRERQKAKEQAGKDKADRLRKENLELESIVASCQQVPDIFMYHPRFFLDAIASLRSSPTSKTMIMMTKTKMTKIMITKTTKITTWGKKKIGYPEICKQCPSEINRAKKID